MEREEIPVRKSCCTVQFSCNAVTPSRICAGDALHSFVLSLFIALNTTRYSHKTFSQRSISMCASVSGRNQVIPSSVLPLSLNSPGDGVFPTRFLLQHSWQKQLLCHKPQRDESLPSSGHVLGLLRAVPRHFPPFTASSERVAPLLSCAGALWLDGVACLNWKYCDPPWW